MKKVRSDEEIKQPKKMTSIGGQALMEGLMMIGPATIAMAVRLPDGQIHVETAPIIKSSKATKIPFVRGSVKIFRQMVTGTRYLLRSAQFIEDDITNGKEKESEIVAGEKIAAPAMPETADIIVTEEPQTPDAATQIPAAAAAIDGKKDKKAKKPGPFERFLMKNTEFLLYMSAVIGLMISVGLFILLPNLLTNLTIGFWLDKNGGSFNRIIYSLFEGVLRISIFVAYLALASKLQDIKRVWMYHGAEHKTIACYESKLPLTVENARSFSKHHPRCGTAFMFIVLLISIIIFSFIPKINILVDMLLRLACVPILAGISYEIIHWSARHDNFFTRMLAWPGMMLQRLTTKEPDDQMLEVAIAAILPVIPAGERGDDW
ncbi:MAG: DUF1385 domain-containing protein [Saccharofermentanales bacterium]